MSNNKNLFFAVFFVVGFIFFWDSFVVSKYGSPEAQKQAAEQNNISEDPAAVSQSPASLTTPSQSRKTIAVSNTEEETVLESAETKATFSTKGAKVVGWQVKEGDHWVDIVHETKDSDYYPLQTFPDLNFSVSEKTSTQVVFSAITPEGVEIEKRISISEEPYIHNIEMRFFNPTNNSINVEADLGWGPGIGKVLLNGEEVSDKDKAVVVAEMRGLGYANKIRTWRPGFVFGRTIDKTDRADFKWVGVDNDHFLAAFLSGKDPIPEVKIKADKKTPTIVSLIYKEQLKTGQSAVESVSMYIGPKRSDFLDAVGMDLGKSIDYGFFGFISKGLLTSLRFLESITGNYGWAIIILTVCVQILFFPLTKKSLNHSVKMKKVQPELKKIQAQFKSDPKRLQVETFNLYKKHGMKFMGMEGCFPMLVQIPIFFAFYRTLRVAYELRGAPWILWVNDLAVADPTYVLPILMGIGMLLQQKLTTVAMDPAQAKMMLFMPIIFTFLFLKLPAGLVLYWVVNSISTIFVQKFLQWRDKSKQTLQPV